MLTTKVGLAFKQRYFAEKWQATLRSRPYGRADFRAMRGTRVMMVAEACCTLPEIVAMTGRRLRLDMPDRCLVRTSTLAKNAIAQFETSPALESSPATGI